MAFTPRLTRPEAGNPYYNTVSAGGYSDAIPGKPTDPGCNVLSNCVGYAYGRFNEIVGYKRMAYLRPVNAENFIEHASGLTVSQTPSLGACMVWRKGDTLSGSDGAGHVAIVEKIVSPTKVVTSESGYGVETPFWTKQRSKGDGNWGAGAGYTFLGFIANPAVASTPSTPDTAPSTAALPVLRPGNKSATVRALQALLTGYGYSVGPSALDGSYGPATQAAVIRYQSDNGLDRDGICGPKTWTSLMGL